MYDNTEDKSLHDVHASIDPSKAGGKWKRALSFFGPAYLISVGYMDPGNWATDIAGGSRFGYMLLWVLLMSNMIALILQSLSARLGIVLGRDLAQCSRDLYPPGINMGLYILAELAIAACDLAEVLGMAIGLMLLLGIPLLYGVMITVLDTFLLLYLQKLGMRKMETFIIGLISVIGVGFIIELFLAKPDWHEVSKGLVPTQLDNEALFLAIGIIGATVMPHNLYLHSALVQTRKINRDTKSIWQAIKMNVWDSALALNVAFFVNAAILVVAGSVFFKTGNNNVASIEDAHKLLAPLLGSVWAPKIFAIALIAAGQSSTITGTLAGQIVMEGHLQLRVSPVARRLITRLLAVVPPVIVIMVAGDKMVDKMLVLSQVLLSMQLAFAVIPLIHFVSDRGKMGEFTIKVATRIIAWIVAAVILYLNIKLFIQSVLDWMGATDLWWVKSLIALFVIVIAILLLVVLFFPFILKRKAHLRNIHQSEPPEIILETGISGFNKVALALDYSDKDKQVLEYALRLAKANTAFILIHIVESVSAQIMGNEAHDMETLMDQKYLDRYAKLLTDRGFEAIPVLGYRDRIAEIARIVRDNNCDLLVAGSHGHKTAKDWLFGETIDSVRHKIDIPLFIAR